MPDPLGQLTRFCGFGIAWCELCFATDRPVTVVIRPTLEHGPVCLSACPVCEGNSPSYLRASAKHFAAEHRNHITRAQREST